MGEVLDLSQYQSHFHGTDCQDIAALENFKPSFLAPETEYTHLEWKIKDAPKSGRSITYNTPIEPNVLLSDDPELLETVRFALSIMGTSQAKSIGRVGSDTLIKS